MKTRIEEIMKKQDLSSSQFADKIGVPRSGLSHVLKGRNNPSLDYVLRILKSFPEIDSNWLLTGEITASNKSVNTIVSNANTSSELDSKRESVNKGNNLNIEEEIIQNSGAEILDFQNKNIIKEEDITSYHQKKDIKNIENNVNKKVEKIVFFYSDGSFEEYKN